MRRWLLIKCWLRNIQLWLSLMLCDFINLQERSPVLQLKRTMCVCCLSRHVDPHGLLARPNWPIVCLCATCNGVGNNPIGALVPSTCRSTRLTCHCHSLAHSLLRLQWATQFDIATYGPLHLPKKDVCSLLSPSRHILEHTQDSWPYWQDTANDFTFSLLSNALLRHCYYNYYRLA